MPSFSVDEDADLQQDVDTVCHSAVQRDSPHVSAKHVVGDTSSVLAATDALLTSSIQPALSLSEEAGVDLFSLDLGVGRAAPSVPVRLDQESTIIKSYQEPPLIAHGPGEIVTRASDDAILRSAALAAGSVAVEGALADTAAEISPPLLRMMHLFPRVDGGRAAKLSEKTPVLSKGALADTDTEFRRPPPSTMHRLSTRHERAAPEDLLQKKSMFSFGAVPHIAGKVRPPSVPMPAYSSPTIGGELPAGLAVEKSSVNMAKHVDGVRPSPPLQSMFVPPPPPPPAPPGTSSAKVQYVLPVPASGLSMREPFLPPMLPWAGPTVSPLMDFNRVGAMRIPDSEDLKAKAALDDVYGFTGSFRHAVPAPCAAPRMMPSTGLKEAISRSAGIFPLPLQPQYHTAFLSLIHI